MRRTSLDKVPVAVLRQIPMLTELDCSDNRLLEVPSQLVQLLPHLEILNRENNRLKVLRAERDWSQADLADQLGVSRQTVNALETGRYDPSLPLAFKIARVFGQPIESIFTED